MPASRAFDGELNTTFLPAISMDPSSCACTPLSILMSVDFPAPFSPSSACTSPGSTSKLTPRKARTPPKLLATPVTRTNGCGDGGDVTAAGGSFIVALPCCGMERRRREDVGVEERSGTLRAFALLPHDSLAACRLKRDRANLLVI